MRKFTLLILLFLVIGINLYCQTLGDYQIRSNVTTGNWNGGSVWQRYNGSSWGNTSTPPSTTSNPSSGVITIQSGKTITIGGTAGANVTADQIVVQGALLVDTDFILTVANGTGTDLDVSGTLTVNGTVSINSSANTDITGKVNFNGGVNAGKVSGSGSFSLASGATLDTKNGNGITSSGSSGSVQCTSRSFNTGANYKYTAQDGAQETGTGMPSSINKLAVENPYGLTLSGACTIASELAFASEGLLYIQDGDLTMGASASVAGQSNIGYEGTGIVVNLDYIDYLSVFVEEPTSLPEAIGLLILQSTTVLIPNDFSVNGINFNGNYFDLASYKVSFIDTDAAVVGNSDVYDLFISMSATANYFNEGSSIERTWTTYSDQFTNTLELRLSYPASLLSAANVVVWRKPSDSNSGWNYVGLYSATGTDPKTVSLSGLTDIGLSDASWDWTISGVDETLPVELSAFTAIVTPQSYVSLEWETQTETGISGFYLFRNTSNDLNSATRINAFIQGTNTSQVTRYLFTDNEVITGSWYYWLQSLDINGAHQFYGPVSCNVNSDNVNPSPTIPNVTSLRSVYPNPFSAQISISYGLAKSENVAIDIYNGKGQKVRTLLRESKSAGDYHPKWDGKDDNNKTLPTGIYFIKLDAGRYTKTVKAVLAN